MKGAADAEVGNVSRATVALTESGNASRAAVGVQTKAYPRTAVQRTPAT